MADEHRMRARADRLRRFDDPSQSDDPGVVAVLRQLDVVSREQQATVFPRAEFRAELRAQLVAITPRLVAEYAPTNNGTEITGERSSDRVAVLDRPRPSPRPRTEQQATDERRPRRSFWDALRTIPVGRPLAVVASLVTVLALVLGGSVYLSQDAVPGDTLYGLKRASERFELSLADNDTERAQKYLEFAETRVDEAHELVSRVSASAAGTGPLAGGTLSPQTAGRVTDALNSADGDTQTASRLLGNVAVDSASPTPLTTLTSWAPSQLTRLSELRSALPAGTPVVTAASRSVSLLQTANTRAAMLQQRVDCKCLKNAPTDAYGPLPIATPTPTTPGTTTPSKPTAPKSGGTRSTPAQRGSSSTAPSQQPSSGGTTSNRPLLPLPSLKLPTLPAPTNSAPRLDLCKVNLLGLRLCPSPTS